MIFYQTSLDDTFRTLIWIGDTAYQGYLALKPNTYSQSRNISQYWLKSANIGWFKSANIGWNQPILADKSARVLIATSSIPTVVNEFFSLFPTYERSANIGWFESANIGWFQPILADVSGLEGDTYITWGWKLRAKHGNMQSCRICSFPE